MNEHVFLVTCLKKKKPDCQTSGILPRFRLFLRRESSAGAWQTSRTAVSSEEQRTWHRIADQTGVIPTQYVRKWQSNKWQPERGIKREKKKGKRNKNIHKSTGHMQADGPSSRRHCIHKAPKTRQKKKKSRLKPVRQQIRDRGISESLQEIRAEITR